VTGVLRSVPRNVYKILVRKGVTPLAGQASSGCFLTATLDIPAGADSADAANVRAALSLLIGSLNSISASIGDTLVTGVI
jgi:ankyrin repeat protein